MGIMNFNLILEVVMFPIRPNLLCRNLIYSKRLFLKSSGLKIHHLTLLWPPAVLHLWLKGLSFFILCLILEPKRNKASSQISTFYYLHVSLCVCMQGGDF